MSVNPIPPGFNTLTPHIIVKDAANAIEFYKKAFGAKEIHRMPDPEGHIMHADLMIGDSHLMLSDEYPERGCVGPATLKGCTAILHVFVENVDQAFQRAVDAGAQVQMPVSDMFWGDRYGRLVDPFGQEWSIATHKEDLSPEQIAQRQKGFCEQMSAVRK